MRYMKLLIIAFVSLTGTSFAQAISNKYLVSTETRDTLYFINDSTGRLIFSSWDRDPYYNGFKPTRILVADLEPYRKILYKTSNKKSKG